MVLYETYQTWCFTKSARNYVVKLIGIAAGIPYFQSYDIQFSLLPIYRLCGTFREQIALRGCADGTDFTIFSWNSVGLFGLSAGNREPGP